MTRTHLNHEGHEAMHLLDLVRAGADVPDSTVTWALHMTGDALGLRDLADDGQVAHTLEQRNVQ